MSIKVDDSWESKKGSGLSIDSTSVSIESSGVANPYVFGRMFPLDEVSVVNIPSTLVRELRVLPIVFSVFAAHGFLLPMFGAGCKKNVTLLMTPEQCGGEDALAARQIREAELGKLNATQHANDAAAQVNFLYPDPHELNLNHASVREAVLHQCAGGILVVYDRPAWTSTTEEAEDIDVADWIATLCDHGVTVVAFEQEEQQGKAVIAHPDNTVTIESDPAAPRDFAGGGCSIRRARRGIYDESPLLWNFWYHVQCGTLDWGMENRAPDDTYSRKKRDLQFRTLEAIRHFNGKVAQRELAAYLEISDSTLYRVLKSIMENTGKSWKELARGNH